MIFFTSDELQVEREDEWMRDFKFGDGFDESVTVTIFRVKFSSQSHT